MNANPVPVAQALANLFENAAKYTSDGGEIRSKVRQKGYETLVSVHDHDIGIEAEMLPRLGRCARVARSGDTAQGRSDYALEKRPCHPYRCVARGPPRVTYENCLADG